MAIAVPSRQCADQPEEWQESTLAVDVWSVFNNALRRAAPQLGRQRAPMEGVPNIIDAADLAAAAAKQTLSLPRSPRIL